MTNMQNLVKIQEDLKNVPLQAVMAYVEGRNPMVPPYLALTELNRRKQVQQSAAAQQQPQGTVKDQIQQQTGLMALQAARQQAAQQNLQQGAAAMPQPQALPVQGAPVQAAPVVKAAEGGLMRIPMRQDMFKADSYAGGGIVAFKRGGGTDDDEEEDVYSPEGILISGPSTKSGTSSSIASVVQPGYKPFDEAEWERKYGKAKPAAPAAPVAPAASGAQPPAAGGNQPPRAPVSLGGYGPLMGMKPRSTSLEDIYREQQEADKLAGVVSPDQRYAKSDEMLKKLREQMTGQRTGQEMAGLAEAMGVGAQKRKWWEAAGAFGGGAGAFRRSQDALYNKQDEAFVTYERTKEKEEDAIRRGNSDEIQKAKREREKAELDLNKAKAEVQYRQESLENKGDTAQDRLDIEREKALMKDFNYQSLVMKQTTLENRLRKDPNDQKAKQELDQVRQEIARKRAEAGLGSKSSSAPAPATRSWQGWSGAPVK